MTWTIKVSFTDSAIDELLATKLRPFKPDRMFGSFSDPKAAHDYLFAEGWRCQAATTAKGDYTPIGSYYSKGSLHAVITQIPVPEDIRSLKTIASPVEQCT